MEAAHQFLISCSQYNFSSLFSLCAAGTNTRILLQCGAFLTTPGQRGVPKSRVQLVSRSLSLTSFLGNKMKFIFPIPRSAEHSEPCRSSQLKQQEQFVSGDVNARGILWILAERLFVNKQLWIPVFQDKKLHNCCCWHKGGGGSMWGQGRDSPFGTIAQGNQPKLPQEPQLQGDIHN